MQSTNFEFMRAHRSDLADEAAEIERVLHDSPGSAIDLLRTFAERLLKHFRENTGQQIHDGQGKSLAFDDLLQLHRKLLPDSRRKQFDKLRWEGNKQHQPRYQTTGQEQKLLEVAWQLACWVGEQLGWGDIPTTYTPPPEGGNALQEMRRQLDVERRQKIEALRSAFRTRASLSNGGLA